MRKVLLAAVLMFLGCTDETGSQRALEGMGFTDITFTGCTWWGCSKDDEYHTKFKAKNPKGQPIEGVVCCGMLKNCTVRF